MIARLALVTAMACSHAAASRGADDAVVQPGEVVERVVLSGALHPTHAVELVVPTLEKSELVIRWLVADGTVVKQGDRVAELDDAPFTEDRRDLQTRLAAAETQLRLARQGDRKQLADRKFAIRQAEIKLEEAKLQAGRPADLITAQDAHNSQNELGQAEDALRKVRSELATATEQIALDDKLRQINVDQIREDREATEQAIRSLVIRAARDGVVVVANRSSDSHVLRAGDSVEHNQVLLTQPDLTKPMEVRAELIDVDDGRITAGMPATCMLDAYPDSPIPCSITGLSPVAGPKLGHDSLRRAFRVTAELAGGEPARMRPGMSVKLELRRPPQRGLIVPRGAVIRGAQDEVVLASGEHAGVTLGDCDAQRCVIARGLADGARLRTGGAP